MSQFPNEPLRELPDNFGQGNSLDIPLIEYNPDVEQLTSATSFGEDETEDTIAVSREYFQAQEQLELQLQDSQILPSSLSSPTQDYIGGAEKVVGTSIGFRTIGGLLTPEIGLKVFVTEKLLSASASSLSKIPPNINNIPIDVEEMGEIIPHLYNQRYQKPVNCGISIGDSVETGTLGCLVQLNNGKLCVLSNNHIIANLNRGQAGDQVIQPGLSDLGKYPQDSIGILEKYIPIDFTGDNYVDAAVAWTSLRNVNPNHVTYKLNPVPLQPRLGMTVMKNGRTTQSTIGTITDVSVNISITYSRGAAYFRNQIGIQGVGGNVFSRRGDSGSLIVTANSKQPVGLLFAGKNNNSLTLANPIRTVISKLNIIKFISN